MKKTAIFTLLMIVAPSSAANALDILDPTFRKALNYAFVGDESNDWLVLVDANQCVFRDDHRFWYLNNVILEDSIFGNIEKQSHTYVGVLLTGEKPVVEVLQPSFDKEGSVIGHQPTPFKQWGFGVSKAEPGKLVRAWKYIYSHGCNATKPPF